MTTHHRGASIYSAVQMQGRLGGDANGVELVILLLEGVLERLARAKQAMERKDRPEQVKLIDKLLEIISEGLRAYLNMEAGGELAQRLDSLYGYCCIRLLEANSKNDPRPLDEVRDLLEPLLTAWRELRSLPPGGTGGASNTPAGSDAPRGPDQGGISAMGFSPVANYLNHVAMRV